MHDEIAIIVYNNEVEYKPLRIIGGKEGETYGPLYMDVFGRKDGVRSSGSLVPKIFTGNINYTTKNREQVAAYNIFNSRTDWQNGNTTFRIMMKKPSTSHAEYTSDLEKLTDIW